jgi:hypothetical protein
MGTQLHTHWRFTEPLKYFDRKHIDPHRWNQCIEQSAFYLPYARFEYLESISQHSWGAIIQGNYEAVFPVVTRKKFGLIPYIYQPYFCQQLGVFGNTNHSVDDFIAKIPRYFLRVHLQVHGAVPAPSGSVILPNLVKRAPHDLERDINKDAWKNIKRLQKLEVYYTQTKDIRQILKLYVAAWGTKSGLSWPKDYQAFESACQSLISQNLIYACVAQKGHDLLGAAIFIKGRDRLHYVCAAPSTLGREVGIMHGIIHHVMEYFPNMDIDFEGSQIASVAAFYKKFNPTEEPYYRIERTLWL